MSADASNNVNSTGNSSQVGGNFDSNKLASRWKPAGRSLFGGVDIFINNLWLCCLLLVVVSAFTGLGMYFRGRGNAYVSENLARRIRNDLYSHLQVFIQYLTIKDNILGMMKILKNFGMIYIIHLLME